MEDSGSSFSREDSSTQSGLTADQALADGLIRNSNFAPTKNARITKV